MAHVGVCHHKEQALFLGQRLQLLGLLHGQAQGLVAGDVDARLEERLADGVVADIGRHHHDEADAVGAGRLSLGHLRVAGVAAVLRDAQLRAGLAALFQRPGEAAGHQLGLAVEIDGAPVRVADEAARAAAHHTILHDCHRKHPFSM